MHERLSSAVELLTSSDSADVRGSEVLIAEFLLKKCSRDYIKPVKSKEEAEQILREVDGLKVSV